MAKTLTEQWRNEELPIDLYYVIDKLGRETIGNDCGIRDMMVDAFNGGNIFIKEVLAPVPSYDEYKQLVSKTEQLEKKLEIATKALKGVCVWANTGNGGEKAVKKVCEKALKEMEGVK